MGNAQRGMGGHPRPLKVEPGGTTLLQRQESKNLQSLICDQENGATNREQVYTKEGTRLADHSDTLLQASDFRPKRVLEPRRERQLSLKS